ncbi:MAG: helix-turn-helix domain-containing protein, partial [Lachnospiraceae bacterium]|nr:helix-turn-helix domain-containing protein [Lachnospiraceae bacterium]
MFQESYNDMITIDELCEMLSIGKNTAYQLLGSGQIHAFKIGRIWKIPRDAVSEYVIQNSSMT